MITAEPYGTRLQIYSGLRSARRRRVDAEHAGDGRDRHRALAQHPRLGAGEVDDRRRGLLLGRTTVEVHLDQVAELFAGLGGGDAAGLPEMLALDTAIGPTSRSSSMATGCSGMRSMTVPWASPRSHCSDGAWRTTRLSAPGQNARISSRALCGTE